MCKAAVCAQALVVSTSRLDQAMMDVVINLDWWRSSATTGIDMM